MPATAIDRIRAACERAIAALTAHRVAGPTIMGETPLLFQRVTPEPTPAGPTWRDKTELDKAIAFEAIRERLPDVWTLLDIVESANPPDHLEDEYTEVTLAARDGWSVTFFYDCGELDYIETIITPDNLAVGPWEWPAGAPGRQMLMDWGGVGCRARLLEFRDEYPARTIDCTAQQGDVAVDEDERDSITFGRIDLIGGYLDWDASVVRRTPVAPKEAAQAHPRRRGMRYAVVVDGMYWRDYGDGFPWDTKPEQARLYPTFADADAVATHWRRRGLPGDKAGDVAKRLPVTVGGMVCDEARVVYVECLVE